MLPNMTSELQQWVGKMRALMGAAGEDATAAEVVAFAKRRALKDEDESKIMLPGDDGAPAGSRGGMKRKDEDADDAKRKASTSVMTDEDDDEDEDDSKGKAKARKTAVGPSVQEFPLEDQPSRQPGGPSIAEDTMGRAYDDGEFIEQYASLGGMKTIPSAGAGPTWQGTTQDIPNKPEQFLPNKDAAYIGGDEKPYRSGGPVQEYQDNERPSTVTRVGPNFLLSSGDSGIAPVEDFKAPTPTVVLKSRGGLFRSVIEDPSNLSGFIVKE
jgi:hypothetical protein